jgi:hypothetical protein
LKNKKGHLVSHENHFEDIISKEPNFFVVDQIDLDMLKGNALKTLARFKMRRVADKAVQPKQGYRRIVQSTSLGRHSRGNWDWRERPNSSIDHSNIYWRSAWRGKFLIQAGGH